MARWNIEISALMMAAAIAASAAPLLVSAQPTAGSPPLIPAATFYGPADIEATALSPSGRWLAVTTGKGGDRVGLFVFDLKEWKPLAVAARYADADIASFHWVNDERLVFNVIDKTRGSGDQRWWPGLFSVSRDGKQQRQLVKLEKLFITGHVTGREPLEPYHELLHVPNNGTGDGADDVIVGEYRFDGTGEFDGVNAKRLNTLTGRVTSLSYGVPAHVGSWLFDPSGEPRVVTTRHKGRVAVYWRAPGQEAWRQLTESDAFETPFWPRFIDAQGTLYVTQRMGKSGYEVLKRFDFASGKPEAEPLVSAPGFDFNGGVVSETVGGRALGIRLNTDAETTVWFDERMKALQREADQRFPGHVNRLNCRRCDQPDMVAVLTTYSDQDPGQLWVYQAEAKSWRKVGDRRPAVKAGQMAQMDFQRVPARDGLELPVWITTPAATKSAADGATAKRPAVVLVHGGPWAHMGPWGWHADAQFLASRGYVVIEPEFRGSTGYGQAHFRAGWRAWGQAMQDDVADALKWAIHKGLVDGDKVCIAGASYGGYATLMGLVRHPELYRCGVAWVAVSDPRLMFKWRADFDVGTEGREYSYPKLIGDPVNDAAMLDSISPVLLADRVKAPLLMAYGGSDRRVPLVHGSRMRQALIDAGRPPEWVVYQDEGHGWLKLETRLDFARRFEQFLAQHLK